MTMKHRLLPRRCAGAPPPASRATRAAGLFAPTLLASAFALVACGGGEPKLDTAAAPGGETAAPAAQPAPAEGDQGFAPVSSRGTAPPIAPGSSLPPGHPPLDGAPAPAAPADGSLPAGHPPIDGSMAGQASGGMGMGQAVLPPVDPNAGTGDAALAWTPPASWQSVPPSSSMRRAQYRVPGVGGAADGECAVFYFGPGQGGDPLSNAQRWAGQFFDANGQPATSTLRTRELTVGASKVLVVEAKGSYDPGPMMGGTGGPQPGWALLGAIAQGPDANWFFKLVGPEATVNGNREAFDGMIQSLRSGG
jgi:hypothetical protein